MIPSRAVLVLAATLLLIAGGCASSGTGASSGRGSSTTITRAQLDQLNANDLHDAVRRLRPTWLSARGPTTLMGEQAQVVVYLDGAPTGSVEALRRIEVDIVESLEYLSPSEATNRYGTNHAAGAILIRTR